MQPLSMTFTIRSAGFRKRLVSARKILENQIDEIFEPMGYFVVLDPGGIAIKFGEEDLGLRPGQKMRARWDLVP